MWFCGQHKMERVAAATWWTVLALLLLGGVSSCGAAVDSSNVSTVAWPGPLSILTVGGTYGWNIPPNGTFFNEWADGSLPDAAIGNVLVFGSNPGSNSSVIVFTTSDPSVTAQNICKNKNVAGSGGTNHFTTQVSLILLKSGITYWFVSGYGGDCEAGMAFSVTVSKGSVPDIAERDVGVAYNVEYSDTSGSEVSGFGTLIAHQPAAFDNSSANARMYFNGDGLNIAFFQYNTLFVSTKSGGEASCHNFAQQISLGSGPSTNSSDNLQYLSVFLGGITIFQDHYSFSLSATDICDQGIKIADLSIRNTSAAGTCSKNPGPPYICSHASRLPPISGCKLLLGSFFLFVVHQFVGW